MVTATMTAHALDGAYHVLESRIAERIAAVAEPLFTTDARPDALWAAYLAAFPDDARAFYTCHSCRDFIHRFGGLVRIESDGHVVPFLWSALEVPETVAAIVESQHAIVARSRVKGVFRWGADPWGLPQNIAQKTGATWTHLSGTPRTHHARRTETPSQQAAALREDFGILSRSLADFPLAVVEEAVRVLQSGALTRSEKAEGVASWLLALCRAIAAAPKAKRNLMWRAVATAPPGFTHVRSSVLGTLLEDIAAGLPFAEVSRRWAEKLHPLQYQRPTAAPSEGQIAVAERRVKELGIERSLARRFATLDDVLAKVWEPRADEAAPASNGAGVFDALRQDATRVKALELPAQTMTWEKFARTVLPLATTLEVLAPARGGYYGLVTAVDAAAPPIIQWDGLDGHPRNPVSWYFYNNGSTAGQWGLAPDWTAVGAVFLAPFAWQEPTRFAHQGRQLFFALPTARETRASGLALFPEILRAELREVRSVIEAYSNRTQIVGAEHGTANGLAFDGKTRVRLRVKTPSGRAVYDVDRWD